MEHQTCPIDRAAPRAFPPQHQDRQPGLEYQMDLRPISECAPPSPKLAGRVALITGGDSGIGRAGAYAFVKEGAKVAVAYYDEDRDAQETAARIRQLGGECLLLRGDLRVPVFAKSCVERTVERFGGWTFWSTTTPFSLSSEASWISPKSSSPWYSRTMCTRSSI